MSFEVGEIVVFESWFRREIYISRVRQIHIDYFGYDPTIHKATLEQKKLWFDSGEYEVVIGEISFTETPTTPPQQEKRK